MDVYIFGMPESVFLHFYVYIFVTLSRGWFEILLTLQKILQRHHFSWTSVIFELKIDIIILIFLWPSPKSSSVIAWRLVLWLKSFNNRCFIHDDNWNTAVEPLSHLHYSFKVSVHNECDDAAQKAVYVLTLGPLNLVASFGFNLFCFCSFVFCFFVFYICIITWRKSHKPARRLKCETKLHMSVTACIKQDCGRAPALLRCVCVTICVFYEMRGKGLCVHTHSQILLCKVAQACIQDRRTPFYIQDG